MKGYSEHISVKRYLWKVPAACASRSGAHRLLLLVCLPFFAFIPADAPKLVLQNMPDVFGMGEYVEYRVHYGWITAGEAVMKINNGFVTQGNRVCARLEVNGRTTGAFDHVLRIRDTWGSFFDTAVNVPVKSYRHIEEGKYRRNEEVYFDHGSQNAHVLTADKPDKDVKIPSGVQDIVSGYYYLRLIDYSRLKPGDVIHMDAYNDADLFKFDVVYRGRDRIKTEFGRINAIVLAPIMPKNSLFDGENSIKFYISDDRNKIPLKIRAELFVGAVELDIKAYGNLKSPLSFD